MESFAQVYQTAREITGQVLAVLLVAVAVLVAGCGSDEGVHTTIENAGPTTLEDVTLHVRGGTYALGDIAPGASASVDVRSEAESDIELTHAGGERLKIDVYIEPGYKGTIRAAVQPDSVMQVDQEFDLGFP